MREFLASVSAPETATTASAPPSIGTTSGERFIEIVLCATQHYDIAEKAQTHLARAHHLYGGGMIDDPAFRSARRSTACWR